MNKGRAITKIIARPLLLSSLVVLLPRAQAEEEVWRSHEVRIGVFGLFRPQSLVLRSASSVPLVLEIGTETVLLEGAQQALLRLRGDRIELCLTGRSILTNRIEAGFRGRGMGGLQLAVPGKIERKFWGQLKVIPLPGRLESVVTMDRESAVSAVVAAESPPGAMPEALKAQAIAARSYFAAATGRHQGYDFCDTTHCQTLREAPERSNPAARAAEATRNLVLTYGRLVVPALFTASCGGRTRTLEEVGLAPTSYPYFAVDCDYCRRHARTWYRNWPVTEAAWLLVRASSEIERLRVGRASGWQMLPGNNYRIVRDGDELRVQGRGAGHGLGLCQLGAAAMAKAGTGFEEILLHYFPNAGLRMLSR